MDSSFDEVAETLSHAGTDISPAELQGFLCGHLVVATSRDPNNWLRHAAGLLGAEEITPELEKLLISLFDKNEACINEADFEFELLLPDEDEELSVRVLLVGLWCQGFLTGFGMGCSDERLRALSDETQSTLSDFVEISHISDEELEDENTSESYFIEVTEYVRMAVLSVAMECRKPVAEKPSDTILH